jgi:hypothetical protein
MEPNHQVVPRVLGIVGRETQGLPHCSPQDYQGTTHHEMGGTPRSEPETDDVLTLNTHVCAAITASISEILASAMMVAYSLVRADLDSHANTVVLGNNCFVLCERGRSADVNAFAPEYM